ncbi:MAG: response regulator [Candidatus Harrisonbacteria bacterium]|nr:response regulator [Candidatus Harrisonbacteria bacterium]
MKKYILIIEDDLAIIKPLEIILSKRGFLLKIARDGEGAIQILEEKDFPDLILLDIILPKMNGFEVLENIKKNPKTKKIPVIILSNLARDGEIERGLAAGAADYFVKTNFSIYDLVEKIKNYL